MKAIRLGNDIEFVWTVEGLANVIGDKVVQLFNVNKGIPETMTYEISGDNISGLFKGMDQKEKGSYRLILYVNRGENGMVTLDCVNAFELVGVSNFGIVNGSDESAITIATINLRSTLDAAPVIPSIQAQADWEQDDSTKVDFIKNKPTLFSGDYNDLSNKPVIPDAQIQSDWNQSDLTKKDFIKNKPSIPSSLSELSSDSTHRVVTDSEKETWNNKSDFSGSYNDLKNKPVIPVVPTKVSAFINDAGYVNKIKTINGESLKGEGDIEIEQVQSDWNQSDSSQKDFIKNKPTIPVVPTKVSAFQNDAGYINDVSDKQDKLVSGTNIKTINHLSILGSGNIDIQGGGGSQVQSDWNETDTDDPAYIKNKPTIPSEVTESTVAGWGFTKNTGDYSKPSGGIPASDMDSSVQTALGKANTALQNESDPTVPSWAKQSSKPTYSASEVGAVPTTRKVNGKALSSDVTLDASDVGALPDNTPLFSGDYNDLTNKPTIPAAQVQSDWNATTGMGVILNKPTIPDVSGKEDKVDIVSASGTTLTAEVGKYYTLSNVGTLAITLPTIAAGTIKVQTVTFYISAGSTPAVTFTSTHPVYYSDGFEIAASSTYEVSAAYNGIAWVVASVKIVIPT